MAVYVAYSLAIQAMMASVGLGMSVGAAPDQTGFVLCSVAFHQTAPAPGDRHTPDPRRNVRFVLSPRKAPVTLRPRAKPRRFRPMPAY